MPSDRLSDEKEPGPIPDFFRTIVESSLHGIWVIDPAGRTLYANERMARMLGCSVDQLLERTMFDFMVDERRAFATANLERRHAGIAEVHDFRFRRLDGSEVDTRIHTTPLNGESGRFLGALGVIEDVTELRSAQSEAQESLRRFERIAERVPDCFWRARIGADRTARIEYVSPASIHVLGRSSEQILSDPLSWLESVVPEDRPGVEAAFDAVCDGQRSATALYRIENERGDVRWVEDRMAHDMKAPSGEIWVDGVARDVTERWRMDDSLSCAQKRESLEILAGGLAHDFNNVLTGILGRAGHLLGSLSPDSSEREDVVVIEEAARRAAGLCRQLLAYSGRGQCVVEVEDLSATLDGMRGLLDAALPKGVSIECELPGGLPGVEIDVTQIQQVLLNLIVNAAEATVAMQPSASDGREVPAAVRIRTGSADAVHCRPTAHVFGARPGGPAVFAQVADQGVGIDRETVGRIFDPFFSRKGSGRGLGLAAVLGIVRSHQGCLVVDSEPGRGTTVTVWLPVSRRELSRDAAPGKEVRGADGGAPDPEKGRLLVVDDEALVRDVARLAFESSGFAVDEACSGEEAVALISQQPDRYVAVLLDVTMSGMGGHEACRVLRRMRPSLPVLFISGFNRGGSLPTPGEAEAPIGFLPKPFGRRELVDALSALLVR